MQKEAAQDQIGRLKRQLEILKTEYKLVDKTRIKSLQVHGEKLLFLFYQGLSDSGVSRI